MPALLEMFHLAPLEVTRQPSLIMLVNYVEAGIVLPWIYVSELVLVRFIFQVSV